MNPVLDLLNIALLTALGWATARLAAPTLPFGVRVPAGRAGDPAVATARRRFGRLVIGAGVVAALVVLGARLFGALMPIGPVIAVVAAVDAIGFLHAARTVRAAKRNGGWYDGVRQAVTVDTGLRTDPVRPPWMWLAGAALIVVATTATGIARYPALPPTLGTLRNIDVDTTTRVPTTVGTAFTPVMLQAGLVVLLALCVAGALRSRPDLDAERPVSSAERYRRRLSWSVRALAASAVAGAVAFGVVALLQWELLAPSPLVTVLTVAPIALVAIGWLALWIHQARAMADEEPSRYVQRDDDRFWHLAGTLYANRSDRSVLVPRRVGLGWTLNVAHPGSWIIAVAVVAVAVLASTGVIVLPSRG